MISERWARFRILLNPNPSCFQYWRPANGPARSYQIVDVDCISGIRVFCPGYWIIYRVPRALPIEILTFCRRPNLAAVVERKRQPESTATHLAQRQLEVKRAVAEI